MNAAERRAIAAMVLATLLWGGTFVAIRDAVAAVPPALLVSTRFIGAGLLFALVLVLRRRLPSRRDLAGGALSGLLMVGGFFLQAVGLRSTSAGSSAFLTCAGTLLAAFWAWLLLRERPGARLTFGIALAMAGSALLSLRGDFRLGTGELITLAGAAMFALQVVAIARFASTTDPVALVCVQSFVAGAVLLPFAPPTADACATLGGENLARFAYLLLAGSTLAPLLQVYAQRTLSAGRMGLLFALEPVFALVFAVTLGAERFEARWWLGAGLILAAVVMVEWKTGERAVPGTARPE
ncbi:MAG TPA: DMT family transporter [Methylomirabilota bacterium]|nr:DMT family transporter [Methylomirabilota bacterium]